MKTNIDRETELVNALGEALELLESLAEGYPEIALDSRIVQVRENCERVLGDVQT